MCERICVRWEELHCSVCVLCARVRPEPGRSFLQFKAVGHHWCVRDPAQMGGGGIAQEKWQNFQPKLQSPHTQQRSNCHDSPCVKSLGGYDQVMQEEGEGL